MLGIEIIKRMGGGTSGGGGGVPITLHDDYVNDVAYSSGISLARWKLLADNITVTPAFGGDPSPTYPNYDWLPSGDPADYEVIITGSGFSSGAAGTYPCDTGVTLTVTRSSEGQTDAHFSAKIQLASNPGVYLAECSVTISATTTNADMP